MASFLWLVLTPRILWLGTTQLLDLLLNYLTHTKCQSLSIFPLETCIYTHKRHTSPTQSNFPHQVRLFSPAAPVPLGTFLSNPKDSKSFFL